ncbi:ribonuclease HI [Leptolyngbya sp. FACHB-17]|uniref:ribonuclease HI n=1 Tax=unclassified Leptolyngbya TaxID=2650499 RepID=UPI001681A935|nr:ribonuclease HI [Leptolyngbya sp. FACHB-17]MBD2080847.1 ribonuclease HI [Leptolyngbya sp. FACHB-17]
MTSRTIQKIYTDGACSGNPGPGGWGTVVYFTDGAVQELGGYEPETTNNRMEMQAAIAALDFYRASGQSQVVALYTDSEYVKNGITKWLSGWKKKGWKTSTGKPVLNQDLWEQLDELDSPKVEWRYVRGHSGDPGNERCDVIARSFSLGKQPPLKTPDTPLPTSPLPTSPLPTSPALEASMTDASQPIDSPDNLPREVRVEQLRNLVDTLHMADEIASKGYLISSSELADLMDINANAVTSRGDHWVWRNWVVSRVRREGNQILWQLERVD